jgi:hypothetical protein
MDVAQLSCSISVRFRTISLIAVSRGEISQSVILRRFPLLGDRKRVFYGGFRDGTYHLAHASLCRRSLLAVLLELWRLPGKTALASRIPGFVAAVTRERTLSSMKAASSARRRHQSRVPTQIGEARSTATTFDLASCVAVRGHDTCDNSPCPIVFQQLVKLQILVAAVNGSVDPAASQP